MGSSIAELEAALAQLAAALGQLDAALRHWHHWQPPSDWKPRCGTGSHWELL